MVHPYSSKLTFGQNKGDRFNLWTLQNEAVELRKLES
jgi:hypothetical protein